MRLTYRFYLMVVLAQASTMLASAFSHGQAASDAPAVAPESAPASDDEVPAPTARDRFRLDVSDLYLGFETDFEKRRVKSDYSGGASSDYKASNLRLEETLGFSLSGFAYDPNLLEYRAQLAFGLLQGRYREEIDSLRRTENDDGFLTEYDVNVDMFKSKPISLNVYARRADRRVPRKFLPSLREEVTETGASALAAGKNFTTEVGFALSDIERHGNFLDEDDEELDNSRFYLDHKWQFTDAHKLRLWYSHEHEESNYQGSQYSFETQRDEFRVEHELGFGPGNKHRVDTFIRYDAEQGDLARDVLEITPRLTLQHKDNFKTIHRYSLYQYEQGGVKVTQHRVDTEAIWQVTDRLQLSSDAYAMHEHVDADIDTNQFGGLLNATYHQPTSLGELSVNGHVGFDQARTAGDAGTRYVRGEAHALGGSRPVFLTQRHIVPGSVLAYNAARTRFYVVGVDYTVVYLSGRAVVDRTWTGRIAENDVVYFDYAYKVPAHSSIEAYRADFLIEHQFKFGLTPYYALETRSEETETSAASDWERDNQDRHRFGLRFQKQRWETGAEYEIFDDSVLPYTAVHLNGRAEILNTATHTMDVSALLSRYLYKDQVYDRRVWWFDTNLTERARITDYLWFKCNGTYHFENDSEEGDTHGVDANAGFELQRGYLTVELTVEYDLLSVMRGDEQGVAVFLNVRRDLDHLLEAMRPAQEKPATR